MVDNFVSFHALKKADIKLNQTEVCVIIVCFLYSVGDFILVHASYQSHLGSDCLFAPNSKLADGIIWLLVIRAGISRGQLLQVSYMYILSNSSVTVLSTSLYILDAPTFTILLVLC
jgi:hypothetical protein